MKTLKLGVTYLGWHYSQAFADIYKNSKNLLWFFYYFFSIPILVRTFFAPWKRMDMDPSQHEAIGDKVSRLIINLLMRVIGMIFRTILIAVGLAAIFIGILVEIAFVLLWIVLPVIIVDLFIKGLVLVF